MRFVAPLLLALVLYVGWAGAAEAAQYAVLIDNDQNAATGCQVSLTNSGTISGIEHRVTATVDLNATPPTVTSVSLQSCQGAAFGPESVIGGGIPVGTDNGISGADVVEMAADSGALVSGVGRVAVRYYFIALGDDGDDISSAVVGVIVLPSPVPALSTAALLLLAGALAWLTRRQLKHPGARHLSVAVVLLLAAGGMVIAANFRLDGQIGDWTGVAPLVTDTQGDGGESDSDLVAGFVGQEGNLLFFRIDVANLDNRAPQVSDATFTLAENSANSTVVGSATFTDPDSGQSHSFAITAGNESGAFAIDTASGQITVADTTALDYETTPSFVLTVQVTDDGSPARSGTGAVTVNLTNVNETPTINDASLSVLENSAPGVVVGSMTASDPDSGQSHSFAITGGNTGGAFSINATTGEITVANTAAINTETNPVFSLTVQVSDNGSPTLSDTATATITVTDVQEPPTVSAATFSIAENSSNGTAVGTVSASDPDLPAQTLSFAITAGNTNGAFAINAATGQITVADSAALDYETTPSFSLTVQATDNGSPALSGSATITVNLTDVNDAPRVTSASFDLDENSAASTVVGTVAATDDDLPAQTLSYAIVAGNTGSAFAINAATGQITVAASGPLDYETNPSFTLTVEVTDNGSPAATGAGTITINIGDINEAPTAAGGPFSIDENSANATVVGTVTAADPDAGQSHSFAITGGNTGSAFAIDSASGQITVANSAALNFETNPSFTLTVQVTDNGTPTPLSGSGSVTVTLVNVNEPPTISDTGFAIAENSSNGTAVGTVSASDPDVPAQTLSFAITGGNTGGAFAINASTGAITVANSAALDYESIQSFSLTVQVSDNASPALSDTATVTITVLDVNEAPSTIAQSYEAHSHLTISVPAGSGLKVGNSDPEGNAFTLTSVGASSPAGATITFAADGSFDFTPPPNTTGDVTFSYTLCDSTASPQCGTGTVTVTVAGPVVWFVDDDAAVGGNGTQAAPFKTLAAAAAVDGANHRIYLYNGDYTDGIALNSGERLIGEGNTGDFDTELGLSTIPTHTVARPTLGGTRPTVGGTVDFASTASAIVRGVSISSGAAAGLTASGATGMDVSLTAVTSSTTAVSLANTTGSVLLSGTTSTGGTNNVLLQNAAGTVSLGGGALSGSTGAAFSVTGGTAAISFSGTINNTANRSVSVVDKPSGSVALSGTISDTGQGVLLQSSTQSTASVSLSGTLTLSTGTSAALTASKMGSLTATGSGSTLTTTTGIALNVVDTAIGAGGLNFRSISSNGATSGIVLSNTGSSAGLTVSGTGSADSGGTIQNTTSHGISLTSTRSPSFASMKIQNTSGSGVKGTGVTNFTFTNGTINNSGTGGGADESNIAFNTQNTGTESNLSGTVTITGNTLSNAVWHGVYILNFSGTLDDLGISNNTLTSATSTASSKGYGINILMYGSTTTAANLTKATIASNVINNFPSAGGIQVQGGNAAAVGPDANLGVAAHITNLIAITNNRVTGNAATKMGTQAIAAATQGSGEGNFDISTNGTVANPLTNMLGSGVLLGINDNSTVTLDVDNNVIVANNTVGANGISGGTGGLTNTDSPSMTVTTTNNAISATDGNGILLVARGASGELFAKVQNNAVAAPLGGVRPGIRIDSGNASSADEYVCLNISGNSSSGSSGTEGIGLRKQGTTASTNDFAIHSMVATASPGVETYVDGLNPAGGGTLLISATSGFSNCSLP